MCAAGSAAETRRTCCGRPGRFPPPATGRSPCSARTSTPTARGFPIRVDFSDLLGRVDAVEGDFWLRFMTSHPKDCTKKLIDAIASSEKVCRHIHLPVQSGSDRVLAAMNRRYTAERYLELIDYAREAIPGVTFSSDIIVGFPGETREDFEETLALVRRVRYNTLYTFLFSPRTGTKAALMDDPVPAEEKSRWFRELLDAESEIRGEIQAGMVGPHGAGTRRGGGPLRRGLALRAHGKQRHRRIHRPARGDRPVCERQDRARAELGALRKPGVTGGGEEP